MSAIRAIAVHKSFGDCRAVDGVTLDVAEGDVCALLGPSGCGKTTMLRLLAGFERPDGGCLMVGDEIVAGGRTFMAPERRRIGMVFQDYALFPHMTVAANVAYALGPRPERSRERVRDVLELVGLADLGGRHPHELSGGQQQRVALARALAGTPKVVLLDEPFSGLDAGLRARVRQEVRGILLAAGVTALFVTHDQEEALSLADHVAVMREGRIEQVGTPEEVYGRPASRWVAEFLGEADVLPGTVHQGWVECELARVPAEGVTSGEAEVLVRPESVALSIGPAGGGRTQVEGVVVEREFFGHDQLVHVELPSGRRLRSRSLSYPVWHPGDRVRVTLDGPVNVFSRA
ncbi:MAG TPA: ABC transporter ATP-binding protein [Solirubrobacteraceae bacterium]|nr:ABC transporter ATP-binding protein [Solirubrobacteraceae bacterium]